MISILGTHHIDPPTYMDAILGVSIRSSLKPWALGFDLEEPDRQDHETPTFGWVFSG